MNPFNPESALALWRAALAEEIGIKFTIQPEDAYTVMQTMYEARKPYPELAVLVLRLTTDAIWIRHKDAQLED